MAASNAAMTSASTPSRKQVTRHTDPHTDADRAILGQRAFEVRNRRLRRRRIARIVPGNHVHHERGISHRCGERTNLIQRRREGEEAISRDTTVGRFETDHAAQGSRLADRAARYRSRAPAGPSRPRPRRPIRRSILPASDRAAHGLRVGPNAEFSVEEPIANSSQFVFPTMMAPAASSRSTTVASYGGDVALEDARGRGRRRCRACTCCP